MTTDQKKTRLAVVPSILAGTAAVIAAASTLYVNLRDDRGQADETIVATTSSTPVTAKSEVKLAAPAVAQRVLLRLDRVQVDNDGSAGSTDWTFQVSADGEPLFSVPMPSLSDKPGENLARPEDREGASAEVELLAGKSIALSVSGWKKGFLPGSRSEVSGKAWLTSGFNRATVTLRTDKPKGPQVVLYFSATPSE